MPASKAKRAEVAERRAKAVAMRIAGLDYQTIADRLGYNSRGAACQDISRALEANRKECAERVEDMRTAELERLDRMLAVAWAKAMRDGNLRAIEVVIKIGERRAKLVGLDAKIEHDVRISDAMDAEIRELIQRLSANTPDHDRAADRV